jgi:phospholipid/cholesterol/gamma-HCH transport system substrate-binding protein
MPTASEVNWAKIRVALMIGASLAILAVLVYLLLGGSDFLQPSVEARTYLTDGAGLATGSPVRFNGIKIGEVRSVQLSGLKDPKKVVRVEMSIMQKYLNAIPDDSTVAVSADNVIGDRFANIIEGKSPRHLQVGGELAMQPPRDINSEDLMRAARQIVSRVDSLLGDIEEGRGELGKFVKDDEVYRKMVNKVTAFEQQIRAATARDTQIGRIIYSEDYYQELRAPIQRLNNALGTLDSGQGTGGKFLKDPAQYDQLRKSVGDLNRTLEAWNAGKGGAGKLLKEDEPYVRITKMLENVNTQVDALNAGEGRLGQMMANSSLHDSLQGSTSRLQKMLAELRQNPKKFLRLKVF